MLSISGLPSFTSFYSVKQIQNPTAFADCTNNKNAQNKTFQNNKAFKNNPTQNQQLYLQKAYKLNSNTYLKVNTMYGCCWLREIHIISLRISQNHAAFSIQRH